MQNESALTPDVKELQELLDRIRQSAPFRKCTVECENCKYDRLCDALLLAARAVRAQIIVERSAHNE